MSTFQNRQKKIIQTSSIGIAANLILAGMKAAAGFAAHSQSLLSDAANSLSDSLSSILTIAGTALSTRKPDAKHPFGYGRIEYMTNFVIAAIVLATGLETLYASIKSIFHPEAVDYSWVSLLVIGGSVVIKLLLGWYTSAQGKKLDSKALEASGADALSDSLLTLAVGLSALLQMFFSIRIDGICGIVIAGFIIKDGIEIIQEALNSLLGEKAEEPYARSIMDDIEKTPDIISAHDLIIHNYGPAMSIGSVNVEISAAKTFGEMYPVIHHLQMEIFKKYHLYLVFGFYSVDQTSRRNQKLEQITGDFIRSHPHALSYHGLFMDEKTREIFCDIVLDYQADRAGFQKEFSEVLKKHYPQYTPQISIDTEFY